MTIFAIDEEINALKTLVRAIRKAMPECELRAFISPQDALLRAARSPVDVAFLDTEMRGMHGLVLARGLKELNHRTNIVFVTSSQQYALDAFRLRASGYVPRPATAEAIQRELANLRYHAEPDSGRIIIRTFGNFEVLVDGEPVVFRRSRSKEVLAILVDRSGAGITRKELGETLWEQGGYDRSRQQQIQTFLSAMMRDLKAVGADDIILRKANHMAVDKNRVSCDLYSYQRGEAGAENAYLGQYMAQYSWGENTTALLDNIRHE